MRAVGLTLIHLAPPYHAHSSALSSASRPARRQPEFGLHPFAYGGSKLRLRPARRTGARGAAEAAGDAPKRRPSAARHGRCPLRRHDGNCAPTAAPAPTGACVSPTGPPRDPTLDVRRQYRGRPHGRAMTNESRKGSERRKSRRIPAMHPTAGIRLRPPGPLIPAPRRRLPLAGGGRAMTTAGPRPPHVGSRAASQRCTPRPGYACGPASMLHCTLTDPWSANPGPAPSPTPGWRRPRDDERIPTRARNVGSRAVRAASP